MLNVFRALQPQLLRFQWLPSVQKYSTASVIRNIGILAHVDAGKTTTVERMLFYSGYIRRLGDVDKGSTVMDCLPMEKQRGITIKAAAIWFLWNGYRVNFIDTPGHADFVFEVERALSVMDGAVVLLDAIAGVEAQTMHVWRRVTAWGLPKLLFINKMDRLGIDLTRVFAQLRHQLSVRPIPMQVPIFGDGSGTDGPFSGLIDIINMDVLLWPPGGDGSVFKRQPLVSISNQELLKQVVSARTLLVETLAETDETLIDAFLASGDDSLKLDSGVLQQAVRRAILANYLVPVFFGSSIKNIGLQPLLDAMVTYLPSPRERQESLANRSNVRSFSAFDYLNGGKSPHIDTSFTSVYKGNGDKNNCSSVDNLISSRTLSSTEETLKGNFSQAQDHLGALSSVHPSTLFRKHKDSAHLNDTNVFAVVFKVLVERAVKYVYVAVRQGCIRKGQWLRLARGGRIRVEQLREGIGGVAISDTDSTIFQPFVGIGVTNAGSPISKIETGNWGIMITSDRIRTGDMFLGDMDTEIGVTVNHVDKRICTISDNLKSNGINDGACFLPELPAPLVSVALEPVDAAATRALSQALLWLLDEDPSLRVDDNSGQVLLSGIGELHIAAACDRLRNHFGVNLRVGNVRLRRREKVLSKSMTQKVYEAKVNNKQVNVNVLVRLEPVDNQKKLDDGFDNEVVISKSVITMYTYLGTQKVETACTAGVLAGLQCGPIEGLPISGAKVTVESVDTYGAIITASTLGAAVRFSVAHMICALPKHFISITEPIMRVIIILRHEKDLGNVIKDITGLRQGKLISMEEGTTGQYFLTALVSLRHMMEYTGVLRGITSGTGSFVMSLDHFGTC